MKLQQFDIVRATFQPWTLETLKEEAVSWIGWRGEWEASWIIEEGSYKGMFAMSIRCTDPHPPFCWAPQADLVDIELVDRLDYVQKGD